MRTTYEALGTSEKPAPDLVTSTSTFPNIPIPATKSETLLDEGIQSLVAQLAVGIKEHKVARIAVFPINDGNRPNLSQFSIFYRKR